MMKIIKLFILLMFGGAAVAGWADTKPFSLDNSNRVAMQSNFTKRPHELIVILPGGYQSSAQKHYPVLYFLDGYWDAPLVSGIHNNMVWDNLLPEMILVGFSYAGEAPDIGDLRERDFTPTTIETQNVNSGEAPQFLQFIEQQVIPYIDKEYRTLQGERALAGNSYGGLFTLYAMYEKPELFKRFISISPAVGWDNYLIQRDNKKAQETEAFPVRLYLSQGGDEYAPFREPIVHFQNILESRNYPGMALQNATIEDARHTSVKAESYTRGLMWVFDDIAPEGPSGLEKLMTGQ